MKHKIFFFLFSMFLTLAAVAQQGKPVTGIQPGNLAPGDHRKIHNRNHHETFRNKRESGFN